MIGHQHIGMNLETGLAGVLAQPVQVDRAIPVGKEAGMAIVPALDNVQGISGRIRRARRGMERLEQETSGRCLVENRGLSPFFRGLSLSYPAELSRTDNKRL